MSFRKSKTILIGLLLFLFLIWGAVFQLPDQKLHLVFCDVGQGDAILVSYQTVQILIDGGPDNRVLNCLSRHLPFWDRKIEMIVLTHPQADHFGGLIEVIKRYSVSQFVINMAAGGEVDRPSYQEFQQVLLAEKAPVYSPRVGDQIRLGPIRFLVLWPDIHFGSLPLGGDSRGRGGGSDTLNDTSIVLKLSFGHFDALLTGDIGFDIENQLDFSSGLGIEVLKVAHHGSKYSTSEEFLQQIRPQLAVISVGRNRFGHPAKEVIERLSNQAIKLLRTDQEGEIEIVSDGKKWEINH